MTTFSAWKVLPLFAGLGMALTACNAPTGDSGTASKTDVVTGTPQETPTNTDASTPNDGADNSTRVGTSCSGSGKMCLSLRYVVYTDSNENAIISEAQAIANLQQINNVWSTCDIAFEIGSFEAVNPADYNLEFNTSTSAALNDIRDAFASDDKLLVVTTGDWTGSLNGAANAWTMMPGSAPYGAVLEQNVGDYPNIIAHELGHYLNLDHISDTSNVMSAVIYTSSTGLSTSQCNTSRSAVNAYWDAMLR